MLDKGPRTQTKFITMHSRRFLKLVLLLLVCSAGVVAQNSSAAIATAPEATVSINQEFLNAFLDAIFLNLKAPSAPLEITSADKERSESESYGCSSVISLQREESGVRTAVKLEQGRITAPIAFAGSYNSTLLGCIEFRGWTDTTWQLEFDRSRQVLLARVQVQEIHLSNVPRLADASLTRIVQAAIDQRINPLVLVNLEQLSPRVPIAPAKGALRLRAKEVRPEVLPGTLLLHVIYEVAADNTEPEKKKTE